MKKLMSLRKLMSGTQLGKLMKNLLETNDNNNCKNNKKNNRRKPKKRFLIQRTRQDTRLLKLIKQKFKKNLAFKEL